MKRTIPIDRDLQHMFDQGGLKALNMLEEVVRPWSFLTRRKIRQLREHIQSVAVKGPDD